MGVIGFIKNLIGVEQTANTKEVAGSSRVEKTSNEPIKMVSKEAEKNLKNEDAVKISNKSSESVYKLIEEMCVEYRMDYNEVKKQKVLESILGCSTEELSKRPKSEINNAIKALQHVLSYQSFKFFWQDRDSDDIKNITQKAAKKYIAITTGRGVWGDTFRFNKDLAKRMQKAGYNEVNSTTVREYFRSFLNEAIASGDDEKISKAYDELEKLYGDILNDTENAEDRATLTAAIAELSSTRRATAARLSISRCANDQKARQQVARGLSDNFEAMSGKDATNNRPSRNDLRDISRTSFQWMSLQDSQEVIAAMSERRNEIAEKINNGTASTEEEYYYNEGQIDQYSGGILGICGNTEHNGQTELLRQVNTDICNFGIEAEVYNGVAEYAANSNNGLPMSPESIAAVIDSATEGNYSKVINNSNNSNEEAPKSNNTEKNNTTAETKSQEENSNKTEPASSNNYTTSPIYSDTSRANIFNSETTISESRLPVSESNVQNNKQEQSQAQVNTNKEKPLTKEQALKGTVSDKIKYAKENNISSIDMAIETLNSSITSQSDVKWALNKFSNLNSQLQINKFNQISKASNAVAAAKEMDAGTLEKLTTFRSYYLKEEIERLSNVQKEKTIAC